VPPGRSLECGYFHQSISSIIPLRALCLLGRHSATWTTLSVLFCVGYCQDRVSWTICLGWLRIVILLISASRVARITGVSHRHPAFLFLFPLSFPSCEFGEHKCVYAWSTPRKYVIFLCHHLVFLAAHIPHFYSAQQQERAIIQGNFPLALTTTLSRD
jgi:hypothetical protein